MKNKQKKQKQKQNKTIQNHTVGTVPHNPNIAKKKVKIYMSLTLLETDTSIKRDGLKLVL